ncbi:transcriptional regulator sugar kinase [Mesoplasma florum W37]|uniref:N-acetylmannosamine kinase n=1 Tax=Mesoplasma florum TaxID=2151 RepID=A0AAD0HSB8_MESFO|nr:ROK family protein [Mesoplasma florum]AGY41726.1 transcriptional regulator sugar kinase [Mesoplasma florum W37]AVN59931.1 ROK family protein [Mesoplasma florum]AVN66065.1 N-acetylmannosamine kinase [Mesoplasma florum]
MNKKITYDLGGSSIKKIVFNDDKVEFKDILYFTHLEKKGFQVPLEKVLDIILDDLKNEKDYFDLGISIPGVLDSEKKKVITESAFCDVEFDINAKFSKLYNMQNFEIENDGKSAAFGEFKFRNDPKLINFIHITIGSALGCGIIINSKLYKGSNFEAGQASGMFSSINDKNDKSAYALDTGLGTLIMKYKKIINSNENISGKYIFTKFNEKDQIVCKLVDEWTSSIAKAIINFHQLLDFDLLTIGGGVSENKQFMEMVIDKIKFHRNFDANSKFSKNPVFNIVEKSKLNNDAGCYGVFYKLCELEEKQNA